MSTAFHPATAKAAEFTNEINKAAGSIKNASNAIFAMIIIACRRYYNTTPTAELAADSGGCDVIKNIVNGLAVLPKYRSKAVDIFRAAAPNLKFLINKDGVYDVENVIKLSAVSAEQKKAAGEYLDKLESSCKEGATLINYDATTVDTVITYKPIPKIEIVESKAKKTNLDLIANALLSFNKLTVTEAKNKLISAINALSDSEIEEAKKAINDKIKEKEEKRIKSKAVKAA